MQVSDQLTRAERVRLEAFAQAVASGMVVPLRSFEEGGPKTLDDLFARAEAVEAWLLKAAETRTN